MTIAYVFALEKYVLLTDQKYEKSHRGKVFPTMYPLLWIARGKRSGTTADRTGCFSRTISLPALCPIVLMVSVVIQVNR